MAEHFNTALFIDHVMLVEERAKVISTLAKIYAPFFDKFHEVCIMNCRDGTSHCENWPSGERLLKSSISQSELLFIYGDNLDKNEGSRSSIHVEESGFGMAFLISLPVSAGSVFFSNQMEQYLLKLQEFAESFPNFFVVAAGWELECDINQKIEKILESYFSALSLSSWIGAPKQLMPNCPREFEKVTESDRSVLLKNPSRK